MTRSIQTVCLMSFAIGLASGSAFTGRAAPIDRPSGARVYQTQQMGRRGGPPPEAAPPAAARILEGTDENDSLTGGDGDDWLFGKKGIDVLIGGGGRDKIDGGEGDDNIDAGPDADIIDGGPGSDTIKGGDGDDTIDGNDDDDVIDGGAGNDDIDGGDGNTIARGGPGNDVLTGSDDGSHFLSGEAGDDRLIGGEGPDTLLGGAGNDLLMGGDGADRVAGEAGDDRLDGGDESDFVTGGQGNDTMFGSEGNDTLQGEAGHDVVLGGSGNDTMDGGVGLDWLQGGTGADVVNGGDGDDIVLIRAGDVPAEGFELVNGGPGADLLFLEGFDLGVQVSGDMRIVDPVTGGTYVVVDVERVEYTTVLARVGPAADRPISILLVNPTTTAGNGRVLFSRADGTIVPAATTGGSAATEPAAFSVPALGSVRIEAVRPGAVSAQVFATTPLVGVADGMQTAAGLETFSRSALADGAIVPVREHQAAGIGTGALIVNGPTASSIKLSLFGADGEERDDPIVGSRQFELPPYGHRVVFLEEVYRDLGDFHGVLTIDGGIDRPEQVASLSVVALERGPGGALTSSAGMPFNHGGVRSPVHVSRVTAGGGASASSLVVVNPSDERRAVGAVRFFDTDGRPWSVVSGNQAATDTASFDLAPGASTVIALTPSGPVRNGSAKVEPVQGMVAALVRDTTQGGLVHVPSATAVSGFITPATRDRASGATTSVSVSSTGSAVTLQLRLRTADGTDVAGGAAELTLPANGQVTRTLEELFPSVAIDSFDGTLTVEATGGGVAASVVRTGPGSGASVLPVIRLR